MMYKDVLACRHRGIGRKLLPFILFVSYVSVASAEVNDTIRLGTRVYKPEVIQVTPVSNHILSTDLWGLGYSYEQPIAKQSTLLFSAGLSYIYGRFIGLDLMENGRGLRFATQNYHILTGVVSVEPRYYYKLNRRYRKGKSIRGNSGGYLSAEVGLSLPLVSSDNVAAVAMYNITPYWGFRRVWGHFLFDIAGGIRYAANFDGDHQVLPTLRLVLGYKF